MTLDDLDNLFGYFYKKGTTYTKYRDIVAEHFENDEINYDIGGMLIKLINDGYLDTGAVEEGDKDGFNRQGLYKLSFEGRFLYENSFQNKPYLALKRKERQKHIWNVFKIVVTVLNSIAILYLMWRAIPESN